MRWWWLVPVALVLAFAVAFGAMILGTQTAPPSRVVGQKYLIGMSQASLVEPWRVTMNRNLRRRRAARQAAGDLHRRGPEHPATDRGRGDADGIRHRPVGHLPNDSEALRPVIAKVHQSIPVIVLDRAVRGEDYTLFIGPNNDMIGYMAGCRVVEMLDGRRQGAGTAGHPGFSP